MCMLWNENNITALRMMLQFEYEEQKGNTIFWDQQKLMNQEFQLFSTVHQSSLNPLRAIFCFFTGLEPPLLDLNPLNTTKNKRMVCFAHLSICKTLKMFYFMSPICFCFVIVNYATLYIFIISNY